ncbi:MAG: hypothetical protein ABJN26_22665 [Stappiaceae bacterium]
MSKKIAGWAVAGGAGIVVLAALGAWTLLKPTIASELGVLSKEEIETLIDTGTSSLASTGDLEALTKKVRDSAASAGGVEIPRGAVVAFDGGEYEKTSSERLSSGCPAGWVRFVQAEGRFVVGSDSYLSFGETGKYELRKTGGSETHALTKSELPEHDHKVGGTHLIKLEKGSMLGGDGTKGNVRVRNDTRTSQTAGLGHAHNNMPPYIALYFCKRAPG